MSLTFLNKKTIALISVMVLAAVSGSSCREDSPQHRLSEEAGPADHDHEHEHEQGALLVLTPQQKDRISPELETAGPGSLERELSFPGEITLDRDSFIQLLPRVAGVVKEVLVTQGDEVGKGEVLAVLESPVMGEVKAAFLDAGRKTETSKADLDRFIRIRENTLELISFLGSDPVLAEFQQDDFGDMWDYGSRLISAYADYSVTKKAYERKEGLYEKRISSQKDYLETQGAYERSRAEYLAQLANVRFSLEQEMLSRSETYRANLFSMKAAERQLGILGLTEEEISNLAERLDLQEGEPSGDQAGRDLTRVLVKAPRAGTILERNLGTGEKVEAETAIFTLADLDQVWACLKVPSRDLASVETGQMVTVESESGESAAGRISVVGPMVSGETRTADLRVIIGNKSRHWKPGLFVRGSVALPLMELPLVVPSAAIQVIEDEEVVFVPEGEGYVTRPVSTGRRDRNRVEILSGLEPGTRYVVQSSFELKSILVTSALDPHAGHGH